MISRVKPEGVTVSSLTTIATPHRGSAFADYMFDTIGSMSSNQRSWTLLKVGLAHRIKRIYRVMEYFGFETGAFSQLTTKYMKENFNPKTPNVDSIR